MNDHILFKGILPALITPLNDDATIRTQAVEPLMKWMLGKGVEGFYVLGGTGEGGVLAEKERMVMAEASAQVLKGTGKQLIVFKDSFAHALLPFLANHYDEIAVIDLRYYNSPVSQLPEELPGADILFAYNVSWLAQDTNLPKLNR